MAAAGGSGAPRPGPPRVQRWHQTRPSPFPWEQDGLDHVKDRMPPTEPHRAWATFSFTAQSGRINECDLFIAVPRGLFLVELKGHPGRLTNRGENWSFRDADNSVRTLRNPLHLTDLKSKELKGQLEWAARSLRLNLRIPRVNPAIFLSAPTLESHLDAVQSVNVYGRDGIRTGLPGVWDDFLGVAPQREEDRRIVADFSLKLPELMRKIGVRASTAHLDFGDHWKLAPRPLDAGPTWEDRLAERQGMVHEEGRVRIYLVEQQATQERRRSTDRAAKREYQVLQGISHRGIAQAVDIREHQGGPAILFRHRSADLRLDSYLALHGDSLSDAVRRDMVRQLAEALRYAHRRSLYHRALAARSIYVTAKTDGSDPVLRIIDWQTAARDFDTTSLRSLGESPLGGEHIEDSAQLYLAPEVDQQYVDPVDLDVFGLGAVAYHILTGVAPAETRTALIGRLAEEGGLHPYAVSDSIAPGLDDLIYAATRSTLEDRLANAETFLDLFDEVQQENAEQAAAVATDPLEASVGQPVDGDWTVRRVLGSGATARALLVERTSEDERGRAVIEQCVLKVALDADKDARLLAEAAALEQAGGGRIVRLLAPAYTIGGRMVLRLEYAGEESLGQRLRAQGRLSYQDLASFGEDMFTALGDLASKGMRHRDLKPDNFGIATPPHGDPQLMLFDFSLADASDRDLKAGTRGYLDPFLDEVRRQTFDDQAERYAAAVVLHEMASADRPVWGDGVSDPRTATDELPRLSVELFEPVLRPGLTAFFERALHRHTSRRFETLRQMRDAWRAVFTAADATAPAPTPATAGVLGQTLEETRDLVAAAASLDTPLDHAGLSPRAVAVAGEFGASTVEEMLDLPLYKFGRARRGTGAVIRKELTRRHRQWTAALRQKAVPVATRKSPDPHPVADGQAEEPTASEHLRPVEELARLLVPAPAGRKDNCLPQVIATMLGLPVPGNTTDAVAALEEWPTQKDVAVALGITQVTASKHHTSVAKEWAATPWLANVRDHLTKIVRDAGRVMTATELAVEVRARNGSDDSGADHGMSEALAIVRAAVTAETLLTGRDEEHEPRIAVLRRRGRVLIALESLGGSNAPTSDELAGYALALGNKADEIAATEPLPDHAAVLRDLRAVAAPAGLDPLTEARLVGLAAAASTSAAASPRLELYPRSLELSRAFRISQAAAGVRPDIGISLDGLLARLRSRFPGLSIGSPTYVEVEDALNQAGFPLEYDVATKRFRPPSPLGPHGGPWSSSSMSRVSGLSAFGAAAGRDPVALLSAKLTSSIERGGFLALNVDVRNLRGTVSALADAFPVVPVNLAQLFLAEFRALAGEQGTEWSKVLGADARFTQSGTLPNGLRSYVSRVWPRVDEQLTGLAKRRTGEVLFVHTAGLIGHYYEAGGHDLLVGLQRSARQAGSTPHGLWLLCPSHSPHEVPHLDGRIVEITGGDAERAIVTGPFLGHLAGNAVGATEA
ncbi:BREX system serine/threonine kinase PglW [Embleya sp. NBC_00888]|nr:BREX system serine/threonine kinase PglW [Embleya sp. NBC_00888]